jgi:hypothetical protein
MYSAAVFSVALALSSSVSALSIPHLGDTFTRRSHHAIARANEARKEPPPGWAYGYLEVCKFFTTGNSTLSHRNLFRTTTLTTSGIWPLIARTSTTRPSSIPAATPCWYVNVPYNCEQYCRI